MNAHNDRVDYRIDANDEIVPNGKIDLNDVKHALENIKKIERYLAQHCDRKVSLVVVTKNQSAEFVYALLKSRPDLIIAENRVEVAIAKLNYLSEKGIKDLELHFIGRLQTKKIKNLLQVTRCIHSIDRLDLITKLDQRMDLEKSAGKIHSSEVMRGFLQFNTSLEATKAGFTDSDLPAVVDSILGVKHLCLCGLMTMAPFTKDQEVIRSTFKQLKEVQEKLIRAIRAEAGELPAHLPLDELSMGMSNDYKVALDEGATCIRLGSVLYE